MNKGYCFLFRCIWKTDYSEVVYNERVLSPPEARVRTLLQRGGLRLGMRLLLSPWQVQYPHRFRNNIAAVTQVRALITDIGLYLYFIANNSREQMHSCRDINYLKSNYIQWEFGLIVVFTGIDSFPKETYEFSSSSDCDHWWN